MPRKAEIGATRSSYVYRLRLPDDLRTQWEEFCTKKNRQSAAHLRALMRYMMRDDMPPAVREWLVKQEEGRPDRGLKERMEIRWTPSEMKVLKKIAEEEGCSPQWVVMNYVRANLTRSNQQTMLTKKALSDSSRQLRSIGTNLNQIAKAMNQGKELTFSQEQIEKLTQYIHRHTEKVEAMQNASLLRWGVEL